MERGVERGMECGMECGVARGVARGGASHFTCAVRSRGALPSLRALLADLIYRSYLRDSMQEGHTQLQCQQSRRPPRSKEKSVIMDHLSQRSCPSLESDAGTLFLRALHAAFPTTAVSTDKLLESRGKGTTRLRRVFKLKGRFRDSFIAARRDHISCTLEVGRLIAPPSTTPAAQRRRWRWAVRSTG